MREVQEGPEGKKKGGRERERASSKSGKKKWRRAAERGIEKK